MNPWKSPPQQGSIATVESAWQIVLLTSIVCVQPFGAGFRAKINKNSLGMYIFLSVNLLLTVVTMCDRVRFSVDINR